MNDSGSTTYGITEIFYSLQGEGFNAGRPALFVRFAGCNLRCPFCDTDFRVREHLSAASIVERLRSLSDRCKFVVLTGGEPTLQADADLVSALHAAGYVIAMETNGTRPVPHGVDWVTVSPKDAFQPEGSCAEARPVLEKADEIKLVFGIGHVNPEACAIAADHRYLQPCDTGSETRNAEALRQTVDYCKQHPDWSISLQLHKIMQIP